MREPKSPLTGFIPAFLATKELAPKSIGDYGRLLNEFDAFTGRIDLWNPPKETQTSRMLSWPHPRSLRFGSVRPLRHPWTRGRAFRWCSSRSGTGASSALSTEAR